MLTSPANTQHGFRSGVLQNWSIVSVFEVGKLASCEPAVWLKAPPGLGSGVDVEGGVSHLMTKKQEVDSG